MTITQTEKFKWMECLEKKTKKLKKKEVVKTLSHLVREQKKDLDGDVILQLLAAIRTI